MLLEQRAYRVCKAQAVARAIAQVDAPAVKALYAQRTGAAVIQIAETRP
jgi:hypothetical protein